MDNITYTDMVYKRILESESEAAFVATDFSDIADYNTVRQALLRLEKYGKIKRILRGVYYNPKYSNLLEEHEAPSPHHVALAIARNYNWTIAPCGNTALNQLGLSTQVTANWSYISDGPYNSYQFGNVELEFKHRNNKEISGMSYKTTMVIQGLKTLGKDNINKDVIAKLKRILKDAEKTALLKEAQQTTSWVYAIIKQICGVA